MPQLFVTRSALALLFAVSIPLGAQSGEPAVEQKLIDGPCQAPSQLSPGFMAAQRALNRKHDDAIKAGDHDAVIAARK